MRVNCKAAVAAIFLLLPALTFAQSASEAKELTKEEILGALPEGIIKPIPMIAGWQGNNEILFMELVKNKLVAKSYDLKSKSWQTDSTYAPKATAEELMRDSLLSLIKGSNKTLSPNFSKAAYTIDNDLYIYDFATKTQTRLTEKESEHILNGYASWVYYEEILGRSSRYKAFWWAPSGDMIAYYRFDESEVGVFPIYDSQGQYGSITETYYPKAGCKNPKVWVKIVDLKSGKTLDAGFDSNEDQYFGIPFWSSDSKKFMVPQMNRDQSEMNIYALDIDRDNDTITKAPIYHEGPKKWIDWIEDMHFTQDGFYMVRESDLWEQIFEYSPAGLRVITEGPNWGIKIIKADLKGGYIYFSARRESSTRNDFYKVAIKSGKITRLSEGEYNYLNINLSPDSKYFVAIRSNSTTPSQIVLGATSGKGGVEVIADSKGERFGEYKLSLGQMLSMEIDGFTLPAKVYWPIDLDTTKRYPVIVSIYGGPNAGTVMDTWGGINERTQWWANEGVILLAIDHRASGHCGREGLNYLHRNLLTIELEDYKAWMRHLFKEYRFIDTAKVGITGFSYGGSMTALAVTEGSDLFKYGIAGGGVYDYTLYDTHYTERYMDTPQDNPAGYDNTILAKRIANYKGDSTNFLRITHGAADDNVHMQNTLQYINALQNAGKQFELMIYPGEYHGYRGVKGLHSQMSDYYFWYRFLLETTPPEVLIKNYQVDATLR